MQKVIWTLFVVSLLIIGCAEQKPEEAARKIVDQQVAIHHEGFELDTSRVTYKVIEQDGQTAMVEVSGNIAVKAVIPLAKKGGEWVLNVPREKAEVKPVHAPAKKPAGH